MQSPVSQQNQSPSEDHDVSAVMRRIRKTDAPRWMLIKDGLDHGPFLGEELINLIIKGQARGDHHVLNLDTGERGEIEKQTDFALFVEHFREKRRREDTKKAMERAARASKLSGWVKIAIAAGVVTALGLGVTTFIMSRKRANDGLNDDEQWSLFERGDMDTEGGRRSRKARAGRRGASMRAGGSYEQAMNQAVDLGDVTAGGGQRGLSSSEVASVMNRNLNSIYRCVGATGQNGLGKVRIDLAIAGDGSVLGSTTRQGSTAFKQCVEGKVRAIRFPKTAAPRTGASFSFQVD